MTLDTLAKIGEFVGGAVVVVSLLYLALQARQSAQAQRSENFGRTVDRVATILARLEDSAELTELVAIGSADPSKLNPVDRIRFSWFFHEAFSIYEFIYHQTEEKVLSPYVWERYAADLEFWISLPGVRAWWYSRVGSFTAPFTEFVAGITVKPALSIDDAECVWNLQNIPLNSEKGFTSSG